MTNEEMTALTEGLPSKSEKIRQLYKAGVSKADITRFMKLRYQHVYNVLLKVSPPESTTAPVPAESGFLQIAVDRDGRITLPADYLAAEGLLEGGTIVCRRDTEGLTIMSRSAALEYLRGVARRRMPDQADLLDALLGTAFPLTDAETGK
jgi:bifunctional DNA-binding transcriptional regulator/antitoxin component of YhaV-PrlF toxin-antitoxin module